MVKNAVLEQIGKDKLPKAWESTARNDGRSRRRGAAMKETKCVNSKEIGGKTTVLPLRTYPESTSGDDDANRTAISRYKTTRAS
jgi:hypothetical protein